MSESDGNRVSARPRQVTVAGVLATVACLLLVVSLFDAMATVRSAAMHDRIAEFLRTPGAAGLGISVSGVVSVLRAVVLLSGALAAAGAVLAVYTLRRHRGARVGLSVVAVLLVLTATFVAGFLPILVAVAATMLWGRDARDWFDGRAPRTAAPAREPDRPAPVDMMSWPPPTPDQRPAPEDPGTTDPGTTDPGTTGPGPTAPSTGAPAPAAYPFGSPARAWPQPAPPTGYPSRPVPRPGRPTTVSVAVWLTWVFAGTMVLAFGLVVLTILVQRDELLSELQKNPTIADRGFASREILGFLWVLSAVCITWSLAAMALAALAFRRVNAGRVGLVICSALAAAVCLLAIPLGWPHAAAAIACAVLLGRSSSRAWFAGQDLPPTGPTTGRRPQPSDQPPPDKPPVW